VVVAFAVAGFAQVAGAEGNPLAEAKEHWRDLDYDLVIAAADRALAGTPTDATKIEALRLKASALVVLGRTAEAETTFAQIFAIDPEYDLPDDTSPRVLTVFRPARARWLVSEEKRLGTELGPSLAALNVVVKLPDRARGGRPLAVTVDLTDPGGIADTLVLSYRRAPDKHYSTLTAPARAGATTLTIPEAFTASPTQYTLELYVRVRHRSGLTLRQEGDPAHPVALAVGAGQIPKPTPFYRTWLFYGVVTVAGAAAITILALLIPAGTQSIVVTEP
jgi:tetratricopeptide (TPR) repeat protein